MAKLTVEQQHLLNVVNEYRDAKKIIQHVVDHLAPKIAIATSLSAEDTVLMHLCSQVYPGMTALAIDTARLPEQTYQLADLIQQRFDIHIQWLLPDSQAVQALVQQHGYYGFRQSLSARHQCCDVRKVDVLKQGLKPYDVWLTGQRREQSPTRTELAIAEAETLFSPWLKVNPLAFWRREQVWQYIKDHQLPIHDWYTQGYTSIGCAPCTRATIPGEHERAGRWWWESPHQKECGIHHSPLKRKQSRVEQ